MTKYELVVVLDPKLSKTDSTALVQTIETEFAKGFEQKDDIGMLELDHPISWNDRAYYISYLVSIDPSQVSEMKRVMLITKWILRFAFYKMWTHEKFLTFSQVNKMFEMSDEEIQKKVNENAFKSIDSESKRK